MFSRIHLPRFTGEVRSGLEVTVSIAAIVITPPRGLSAGKSTRRNPSPCTPVDAIERGQAMVEKRVLRSDEIQQAAIFGHDVRKQRQRFLMHVMAQVGIPIGKQFGVGKRAVEPARLQPLVGEILHQRPRFWVAEHAPHLRFQLARSWPRRARSNNSSSGILLHRKYDSRDASSHSSN